jgi:hypothetical protein
VERLLLLPGGRGHAGGPRRLRIGGKTKQNVSYNTGGPLRRSTFEGRKVNVIMDVGAASQSNLQSALWCNVARPGT